MPPKISMETVMEAIKTTFETMFKEHEKNVKEMISEFRREETEKLQALKMEITDFKTSLEFTQDTYREQFDVLKNENEKLKNDLQLLNDRISMQEDRSRRNNLRFDGIAEIEEETWEKTENLIYDFLKTKLNLEHADDIEIERAHRVRKKVKGKPRTIVVRFLRFKDKSKILRSCKVLKDLPFSVYEDFSRETAAIRKDRWKEVLQNRANNKISYLSYRDVVCKDR